MRQTQVVRGRTAKPTIEIFISGDENATVAEVHYNDEYLEAVSVASSKRIETDQYDEAIGMHLAAGRALRDVSRIVLKQGNKRVKMKSDQQKRAAQLQKARNKARKRNADRIKAELRAKERVANNGKSQTKKDKKSEKAKVKAA